MDESAVGRQAYFPEMAFPVRDALAYGTDRNAFLMQVLLNRPAGKTSGLYPLRQGQIVYFRCPDGRDWYVSPMTVLLDVGEGTVVVPCADRAVYLRLRTLLGPSAQSNPPAMIRCASAHAETVHLTPGRSVRF